MNNYFIIYTQGGDGPHTMEATHKGPITGLDDLNEIEKQIEGEQNLHPGVFKIIGWQRFEEETGR